MNTPTPLTQVRKTTPAVISETAERVFGEKEFLPLATFVRKTGLNRDAVLEFVADGTLDAYEYSPGKYRKISVSKVSFIRLLKATSLRNLN